LEAIKALNEELAEESKRFSNSTLDSISMLQDLEVRFVYHEPALAGTSRHQPLHTLCPLRLLRTDTSRHE
jgi:hypothetical protein